MVPQSGADYEGFEYGFGFFFFCTEEEEEEERATAVANAAEQKGRQRTTSGTNEIRCPQEITLFAK